MKHRISALLVSLLSCTLLIGCAGQAADPELSAFKDKVDSFCSEISDLDTSINAIDPQSEDAVDTLFNELDTLDAAFKDFAEMDFPAAFDYLEEMADEAGSYMKEAVASFKNAYEEDTYNEAMEEYAFKNYERAYKRINIILTFIRGEEPDDDNLQIEYSTDGE
jgi:hypothetical protein